MAARSPDESKETDALRRAKAKRAAKVTKDAEKAAQEMAAWEKGKPKVSPALAIVRRRMREKWLATQGQRPPDGPDRLEQVKGPNRTIRS